MRKELGKISRADFGIGGYQGCMIGLDLSFEFSGGGGMSEWIGFWDKNKVKVSGGTRWSESDRRDKNADTMEKLSDLLYAAKVDEVHELVGMPVEVTIDGYAFNSFRILTEVL